MEQGVGVVMSRVVAKTGKKLQPKYRLKTLADLDRRCKAQAICAQLRADILGDLGGADRLSTLERLQAEHAALLAAVLAHLGVRWLSQDPGVSTSDLATVSNSFNRIASNLGLSRRARDVSPPSLGAYIESLAAEEESEPS